MELQDQEERQDAVGLRDAVGLQDQEEHLSNKVIPDRVQHQDSEGHRLKEAIQEVEVHSLDLHGTPLANKLVLLGLLPSLAGVKEVQRPVRSLLETGTQVPLLANRLERQQDGTRVLKQVPIAPAVINLPPDAVKVRVFL